jgi:hypothetical protein
MSGVLKLDAALDGKAVCQPEGPLFHWLGHNSERARRDAANRLLEFLAKYEEQEQPYHLIGHSHGGNVINHAILNQDGKLKFLRSWATIGTPFLHYRWSYFYFAYCLILFFVLSTISYILSQYLPVLAPLPIVLNIMCLWSLFAGSFETMQHIADEVYAKLERDFGPAHPLWRGITSSDDEAVALLRASLKLSVQVVKPLGRLERLPTALIVDQAFPKIATLVWLLKWPGIEASRVAFNWFVAPVLNWILLRSIARRIQGNDLPGSVVHAVSFGPSRIETNSNCASPSIDAEHRLTLIANAGVAKGGSLLRRSLAQYALETDDSQVLLGATGVAVASAALIHTSYFKEDATITELVEHIASHP